jgi:hypothetical protein
VTLESSAVIVFRYYFEGTGSCQLRTLTSKIDWWQHYANWVDLDGEDKIVSQ